MRGRGRKRERERETGEGERASERLREAPARALGRAEGAFRGAAPFLRFDRRPAASSPCDMCVCVCVCVCACVWGGQLTVRLWTAGRQLRRRLLHVCSPLYVPGWSHTICARARGHTGSTCGLHGLIVCWCERERESTQGAHVDCTGGSCVGACERESTGSTCGLHTQAHRGLHTQAH